MEEAVRLFEGWARERVALLPGATLEIVRLPGRTPLMLISAGHRGKFLARDFFVDSCQEFNLAAA